MHKFIRSISLILPRVINRWIYRSIQRMQPAMTEWCARVACTCRHIMRAEMHALQSSRRTVDAWRSTMNKAAASNKLLLVKMHATRSKRVLSAELLIRSILSSAPLQAGEIRCCSALQCSLVPPDYKQRVRTSGGPWLLSGRIHRSDMFTTDEPTMLNCIKNMLFVI